MAKGNLVVVESVAKARTIEKFLGSRYTVRACMGHVRDLPKSALGVDTEHDFQPKYLVPKEKKDTVKTLKSQAKNAETVYLATDPDREGEAIAWHLVSALELGDRPVRRIEFHEITKGAIQEALAHPRGIDLKRVDAQQARRVLDRLVGYKLSPLLWSKVRPGLSAGRVQSVALRLVVDRERSIDAFAPVEYWSIEADLAKASVNGKRPEIDAFRAQMVQRDGKKLDLTRESEANQVLADLERAQYRVADVRKTERTRNPSAPFTTSTLQQEASRKLGFTANRTMRVAQQLYEGVDIGQRETVGLITYMRTDSTTIADSAIREVRDVIASRYGQELVEPKARVYRAKSRLAQEAHEAIRPTLAARAPDELKQFLSPEQFRLYDLIWKRFVASQMASARFDVTTVDINAGAVGKPSYLFRVTGSILRFPGFLSVYTEGRDEGDVDEDGKQRLPELNAGEPLNLLKLIPEQHFTQPPPRYTEATLVKALEENGIGRPSTYAPIMSTIQDRLYVEKVEKRFQPTELGLVVNDLLVEHFPDVMNVEFTAGLEEKLDDVARGEAPWVPLVRGFYEPFEERLEKVSQDIPRVKVQAEITEEVCEKCGKFMAIRISRFGRFLGCSGFPECRNAKPILNKTGVECPEDGGDLVEKRAGKTRRAFYGCANYPGCSFSTWSRPVPERCATCGWVQVEAGKEKVRCLRCSPEPERRFASTKGAGASTNGKTAVARRSKSSARATSRRAATGRSRGGKVVSRSGAR